eukprot:365333-Chlamydomonas_euryale.AAC.25
MQGGTKDESRSAVCGAVEGCLGRKRGRRGRLSFQTRLPSPAMRGILRGHEIFQMGRGAAGGRHSGGAAAAPRPPRTAPATESISAATQRTSATLLADVIARRAHACIRAGQPGSEGVGDLANARRLTIWPDSCASLFFDARS